MATLDTWTDVDIRDAGQVIIDTAGGGTSRDVYEAGRNWYRDERENTRAGLREAERQLQRLYRERRALRT